MSVASTVYKDFALWTSKKAPPWHPIKKMRYVFWRMIAGCTVTDALEELHWSGAEFWHLVDLKNKKHDVFREEYVRAKRLQGRAFADQVVLIGEGRDPLSRQKKAEQKELIDRAMKKIAKQKSMVAAQMLLTQLLDDLSNRDKSLISRNRLQIDSAKWIASKHNPAEYGDSSRVALGLPDGGGEGDASRALIIQFVAPDGRVVDP